MAREIVFSGVLNTEYIYSNILEQLRDYYRIEKKEAPIFNCLELSYIEPEAVPLLIVLGQYFSRLYNKPLEIIFKNRSKIKNFLINIGFFSYCRSHDIFCIESNYIDDWLYSIRDIHHIIQIERAEKYNDVMAITDEEAKRTYLCGTLKKKIHGKCYTILSDTHILPKQTIDITVDGIGEILANASLYSSDSAYAYLASDRFGTKVGICDCGIGFEESFHINGRKWEICERELRNLRDPLRSFYIIMEVLNYSYKVHMKEGRNNLWTIKRHITLYDGLFRVHYGNVQVTFTGACRSCTKIKEMEYRKNRKHSNENLRPCIECLLNTKKYSVNQYEVAFRGVHIEFVLLRE